MKWNEPKSSALWSHWTYEVAVIPENGEMTFLKTEKTAVYVEKLQGGTIYYFKVAAVDGLTRSLWSSSNAIRTEQCKDMKCIYVT